METADFDQGNRVFFDAQHFPYGLGRSGEFSRDQVALLEAHGFAYKALASGDRSPTTPLEEEFLEFCRVGRDARNSHEKTWQRYCAKLNKPPSFTLGSSASYGDSDGEVVMDVGDFDE